MNGHSGVYGLGVHGHADLAYNCELEVVTSHRFPVEGRVVKATSLNLRLVILMIAQHRVVQIHGNLGLHGQVVPLL